MKMWLLAVLVVLVAPAWAVPYTPLRAHLVQGGLLVGQTAPGATLTFEGATVPTDAQGRFVLGFDRFQPTETTFKICQKTACTTHTVLIEPRTYVRQTIQGVPGKTVNPNPAQTKRVAREAKAIQAARRVLTVRDDFAGAWVWPVTGRISGVYGSSRTYNGEERNWHKGLDIARPTGTPVVAPAGGRVALASDTFMNGNLIVLDHGQQLFSVYAHLHSMDVKTGAEVAQGARIGTVGTTGRSTGPHLHWGLFWRQEALDPALLLGLGVIEKPQPKP
jgi:hypothetical protein